MTTSPHHLNALTKGFPLTTHNTETAPTADDVRLSFRRARKLGSLTTALTAVVTLACLLVFAAIAWWWPHVLLPTWVQHGPRFVVAAVVVGSVIAAIGTAIHSNLHSQYLAGCGLHHTAVDAMNPLLLLTVITTTPVWPAIADAWNTNTNHGLGALGIRLLVHVIPTLTLGVLWQASDEAAGEYRMRLEGEQWAITDAEIKAHQENTRRSTGIRLI